MAYRELRHKLQNDSDMESNVVFQEDFTIKGGDFLNAGESSIRIRTILTEIGVDAAIIRRVAIAAYEAEMNVVMYADIGKMRFLVTPGKIHLLVEDQGQGIENIEMAMQPGYSTATEEMREKGFGAGMGLPNIKKNADVFNISSIAGKGTTLKMVFELNGKQN
jgi:anti-sigma regulatory factor (Ser/Thr protein kinase)